MKSVMKKTVKFWHKDLHVCFYPKISMASIMDSRVVVLKIVKNLKT